MTVEILLLALFVFGGFMAGLLQTYADRNKALGDNTYDIPEATSVSVSQEQKTAAPAEKEINSSVVGPGINQKPLKGAIIRGDSEKGFTRWDGMSQAWVPVKTFPMGGLRYWWDDKTEKFYPFQEVQSGESSR